MHILYTARLEEIHSENLSIWNFPTESNLLDSISIRNSVPLRLLQWLITSPHHPIRFPDERWVAAKGKGKNDEVRRSWSQESRTAAEAFQSPSEVVQTALVAKPVLKFRPGVAVVHRDLLPLNHQLFLQKKWFQLFLYRGTHVHFPMAEHPSEESVLLN